MNAIARLSTVLLLSAQTVLLGQNSFTKVTTGEIATDLNNSYGCAWGDFDGDGFLDVFVANAFGQRNCLYRNQGDGTFRKYNQSPLATDPADACAGVWADYDNDGDLDLYGGAISRRNARLYRNHGGGVFEQIDGPGARAVEASGAAWADVNNDGLLDLFVCSGGGVQRNRNQLFLNNPGGGFLEIVEGEIAEDLEASVGCAWGDYDNDGHLDLFVANAMGQNDSLYRNNGDGTFHKIVDDDVVLDYATSMGCCWGDYNNDGFLDLFVAAGGGESPNDPPEPNLLYRNNGNANGWLLVKLIGTVSNRSAIGAKVRARATIGGKEFWQLREISGGSGYCSQNDLRAHFGLGDATQVDTLRIEWPSGIVQELKDVPARQILTVTEPPRLVPQGAGAFQIQCWMNQSFEVQASTDLTEWTTLETVTNSRIGALPFVDAQADLHQSRYYRVLAR